MTLSTSGLIGMGIGLLCALTAYVAVSAQLKQREAAGGTHEAPNVSIIRAILLADFVVLAAVGYYVGQLFD